ncbi:MAG: thiamine pyrophosphate-dependent enzyme [Planctomycetota bacterium]
MSTDRVAVVESNLDRYLKSAEPAARRLAANAPVTPGSSLVARKAVELFEDQVLSRALDVAARELKREGKSFYTISSAGHEQNAVVGALLRTDDPAFLHYRSGAFMMARSRQAGGATPLFDTLLSLVASKDDPISHGRHKVWGSRALWVPPQTSTIASHVPKAVGTAFALSRARRLGLETGLSNDAIVCCTFGDASANHATALTGINAARYSKRRANPTPILFVCEDNKRGISVETPPRWIADFYAHLPHLRYFSARGDLTEVWENARLAIHTCRSTREPVFLHLRTQRLWGHAGSDIETGYRSLAEIEAVEAKDPLLANARLLVESGAADPRELMALVVDTRERVAAAAAEAVGRPKLTTRAEVMAPLAPYDERSIRALADAAPDPDARRRVFGRRLPEEETSPTRRTLAARINAALTDAMIRHPEVILFGEDVGRKGGVYGVTRDLEARFGTARCFDTLLDETTILGVAQGAAHIGLVPIPEIQYLAYLHNAIDQLRGEAATLSFFSDGQFTNPMVVRIAGLAYQKGFGGHFHNDNSLGALREIPGLLIACPSRGDDAARLLRGALAAAKACGRVAVFLEPIALYHERDLFAAGDDAWLFDYPVPGESAALLPGEVGVEHPDATDLTIASYANGFRMSLRVARELERQHGIAARVLDLRWLAPLPHEALREHAEATGNLLVVDECRATGAGVADAIIARLAEDGFGGKLRSVRAADSFVPLGTATEAVLVREDQILDAAIALVR